MRHIGLTGNIASGKSAVAALLAQHGASIIDADLLAREAIAPGTDGYRRVVAVFGPEIVREDGTLDRTALRHRVFQNPGDRSALNAIVHPAVGALRVQRLDELRAQHVDVVVSEVPLLFEVGLEHEFDAILFVDAPESERLSRLVRDRGLSVSDAQAMMDAQWPAERKRRAATWVIDNDGSPAQLAGRVTDVWTAIRAMTATVPQPPLE